MDYHLLVGYPSWFGNILRFDKLYNNTRGFPQLILGNQLDLYKFAINGKKNYNKNHLFEKILLQY